MFTQTKEDKRRSPLEIKMDILEICRRATKPTRLRGYAVLNTRLMDRAIKQLIEAGYLEKKDAERTFRGKLKDAKTYYLFKTTVKGGRILREAKSFYQSYPLLVASIK